MSATNQWITIGVPVALSAGVATGAAAYVTFVPGCKFWGPVIARGPTDGQPRVALTFDDGPYPGGSDRVLDILGELGVKATFFVIGCSTERHPELVARMHREGHLVANHSFDHSGWGLIRGIEYWRRQIERTDTAIEQAIGLRPRISGALGIKTWATARAAASGHTIVTWTRRGLDGISTTPQKILGRLMNRTLPGEIVLLHDGVSPQSQRDPSATIDTLRPLILGWRSRGLQIAGLDELTGVQPYSAKSSTRVK